MIYASSLIDDVLMFLCFLRSRDIRPAHGRYLPPHALAPLSGLLQCVDAPVHPTPRSERQLDRLRFVHYLCECARLIAPTSGFLKPTPAAAHWATLSPTERARALVHAGLLDNSPQARIIWCAFRLPRWQASRSHLPLPLLLFALQQNPTHPLTLAALSARLPIRPSDDIDLNADLQKLLRYLDWFDLLMPRGAQRRDAARLHTRARLLLQPASGGEPATAQPVSAPKMTSVGSLIVPPGAPAVMLYELSRYAQPVARIPQRRYRLAPQLIQRALQSGSTLTQIIRFLESATRAPLPPKVRDLLGQWAEDSRRLTISPAVLLEVDTPERLTALLADRRMLPSVRRTITPRIAEVRAERASILVAQLQRRGLSPQAHLQSDPHTRSRGPHGLDQLALMHLYVCALLCGALPDAIPPRAQPPDAVLRAVERQLTPRDRAIAEQLVEDCVQQYEQQRRQPAPAAPRDLPAPLARTLTALQAAIDNEQTLMIDYYTPSRDEITRRKVDPLRIEWRAGVPYLIAYCHIRMAERTFRVDRIMAVAG